ncbi:MAG: protein translocase subunit SecD, partial [Luminiphilus sp.]
MLNRYSLWKNLMILGVVLFGFYYAAPNLYAPDPALQIGGASGSQTIDSETLQRATDALSDAGIN